MAGLPLATDENTRIRTVEWMPASVALGPTAAISPPAKAASTVTTSATAGVPCEAAPMVAAKARATVAAAMVSSRAR